MVWQYHTLKGRSAESQRWLIRELIHEFMYSWIHALFQIMKSMNIHVAFKLPEWSVLACSVCDLLEKIKIDKCLLYIIKIEKSLVFHGSCRENISPMPIHVWVFNFQASRVSTFPYNQTTTWTNWHLPLKSCGRRQNKIETKKQKGTPMELLKINYKVCKFQIIMTIWLFYVRGR